jgi:hypothetical protein
MPAVTEENYEELQSGQVVSHLISKPSTSRIQVKSITTTSTVRSLRVSNSGRTKKQSVMREDIKKTAR